MLSAMALMFIPIFMKIGQLHQMESGNPRITTERKMEVK
jgi:hypothetical protein